MSPSGSRILDPVYEGVELLLQKESGSASFGVNMVPSLSGVDLTFFELNGWILLVEPSAQISYMIAVNPLLSFSPSLPLH
jgi:hypothetical protein